MTVSMMIQFEGKQLTLPINPSKLTIERSANNENIDIIGIGNATRKGNPSLTKVSLTSFFPAANSYFYTGVTPQSCVDFINSIWKADNKNNNVAKIVTSGLPLNLNMFFVIDSFVPEMRAGEEEDIYYTLNIKEYVPYGVKTVTVQQSGLAASRASAAAKAAAAAASNQGGGQRQTYTVVRGDCLWNITKACCGNGARWKELYNLNKSVIGNNPNLIYPGQVLVLPDGWNTPTNVTKLTNVSTSSSAGKSSASTSTSSAPVSAPVSTPAANTSSSSTSVPSLKDLTSSTKKLTPSQQLELEQLQRQIRYNNLGLHM